MPNPPEIVHTGDQAFYSAVTDRITMPAQALFESADEYWSTLWHEVVHSSGSEKRLSREGLCEAAPFGSPVYSKEELCAELGAAYLCAEAGISNTVVANQATYLAGWLRHLQGEPKLLIHAAA